LNLFLTRGRISGYRKKNQNHCAYNTREWVSEICFTKRSSSGGSNGSLFGAFELMAPLGLLASAVAILITNW